MVRGSGAVTTSLGRPAFRATAILAQALIELRGYSKLSRINIGRLQDRAVGILSKFLLCISAKPLFMHCQANLCPCR
jgi:hypothetical protein